MIASAVLIGSCDKEFTPTRQTYPLLETTAVTNIDQTGAQFNAHVLKMGTAPVLDYGFMYVEKPNRGGYVFTSDTSKISLGSSLKDDFLVKVSHKLNKGINYYVFAYAVTAGATVFGSPVLFQSVSTSPAIITSFSADSVLDGDVITIYGENFNWPDFVTIGNQRVAVLSNSYKSVSVIVPPVQQAGPVKVQVYAYPASAISDQLIVLNPSISSFSPTQGPAGTTVVLNGRFSSNPSYNRVAFNGVSAPISDNTASSLVVSVPTGVSGSANISITVNGKTSAAAHPFSVN